jgi:hypothetical protein
MQIAHARNGFGFEQPQQLQQAMMSFDIDPFAKIDHERLVARVFEPGHEMGE